MKTIIFLSVFLSGCMGTYGGGYGGARIDEQYDGIGFRSDIVYIDGVAMYETKVPFCPEVEVGGIFEDSVGGDELRRWEANAGCRFSFSK